LLTRDLRKRQVARGVLQLFGRIESSCERIGCHFVQADLSSESTQDGQKLGTVGGFLGVRHFPRPTQRDTSDIRSPCGRGLLRNLSEQGHDDPDEIGRDVADHLENLSPTMSLYQQGQ
jgi:hypothetical protein